jgi:hypothetical protein
LTNQASTKLERHHDLFIMEPAINGEATFSKGNIRRINYCRLLNVITLSDIGTRRIIH